MRKMQRLCLAAILAALGCAATFIHIPYPLGYLNLGDCIVLLCGVLLPPLWAMAAAGIGSALQKDLPTGQVFFVTDIAGRSHIGHRCSGWLRA